MAPDTSTSRPLPAITPANAYFWQSGADGNLRILQCGACGLWIHPFAGRCPRCRSDALAPQVTSGRGRIAGFTVNHHKWTPDLQTPYVVTVVELAEQDDIRLMTNLPRTPIDDVHIGMAVQVYFERHGDTWLPMFEAAEDAA